MEDIDIVLFIADVSIDNCLATNECDHFDSEYSESEDEESPYDEIPEYFEGLKSWINETNVLCCHCSLSYKAPPVFIPQYISKSPDRIYIEKKLCCSFPCGMAYIEKTYTDISQREEKTMALKHVYKIFTGKECVYIQTAPPCDEIDIFGGKKAPYTADQFQRHVYNLINPSIYLF